MKVGTVTVSNIRLAEMIGATARMPRGDFFLIASKLGGIRYWAVQSMTAIPLSNVKRK